MTRPATAVKPPDPAPGVAAGGRPRPPGSLRVLVGRPGVLVLGLLVTVAACVVSVQVGSSDVSAADTLRALWQRLVSGAPTEGEALLTYTTVWELRIPRVALAALGGAALSVAGVVFQGVLRNPLVSPFTLGIAPAAAFGASLAILFGRSLGFTAADSSLGLVLGGLVAGMLCAGLVIGLSTVRRAEATTLILFGIALTQLFTSMTAGLQYTANEQTLAAIIRWTWGSVNDAQWYQVVVLAVAMAVALPHLLVRSGSINAIAFAGDDAAKALGVPVGRRRIELLFVAVLITAVTIAFTGIIGFIGLVGPHIARLLIGADHRFLIPFGAVVGAVLLLVADAIGRVVLSPAVVPAGIIDAFIGAPIFIYLILRRRKAF